jgi:DNA-binding phage protein
MFSTNGRTRALTDTQVRRILQWQRDRKTLGQVARENGVSCGTIYTVIRSGGHYKRSVPLTDAELGRVLEWRRNRKTLDQVAREYGVSSSTIRKVIRTGGLYKRSASPAPSMGWSESKRRGRPGR